MVGLEKEGLPAIILRLLIIAEDADAERHKVDVFILYMTTSIYKYAICLILLC